MADLDLHEIADTPGAGKAKAILEKHGLWDEYAGLPEGEYRVRVEYEVRKTCDTTVTVKARCEDEAEDKACVQVEDDAGFDVEIFTTAVVAKPEAKADD